jgi:hypothetical protein
LCSRRKRRCGRGEHAGCSGQIRQAGRSQGLIEKIKAADPANSELRALESKYRYLDTGRPAAGAATASTAVDPGKAKQTLADWNEIVKLEEN